MKKKTLFSGLAIALTCIFATPAFADGTSWVNGNVGAGASVSNGYGGFSAGYEGSASTLSGGWYWGDGMTQVDVAGATNGYVSGQTGTTNGYASSGSYAQEGGWSASVGSGSLAGSSASVMNGIASSSAGAGASGSAQSDGWWW